MPNAVFHLLIGFSTLFQLASGFANLQSLTNPPLTSLYSHCDGKPEFNVTDRLRRSFLTAPLLTCSVLLTKPQPSFSAGTFTPGGTLVDREVGVTVGNPEASLSRKINNDNVLFAQDNYFKFGVAAKWIEPDATDFPTTMPFVLSQQRYDSMKKYGERVRSGAEALNKLDAVIKEGNFSKIAGCDDPTFALRPLGLLANGFLASENSGTTNELLLARWYINEMYLRIGDIQSAPSELEALKAHDAAKKAMNSYFSMLNRVITPKVGNKFDYIA